MVERLRAEQTESGQPSKNLRKKRKRAGRLPGSEMCVFQDILGILSVLRVLGCIFPKLQIDHIDDIRTVCDFRSYIKFVNKRLGEYESDGEAVVDVFEAARLRGIRHQDLYDLCFDYRVAFQLKERLKPQQTFKSISASFSGARYPFIPQVSNCHAEAGGI